MRATLVATVPISMGPGNSTVNTLINAVDLSVCEGVTVQLVLTTCATDLADKLNVEFQETRDPQQTYWDTRARFTEVAGTQSASAAIPYAEQLNIWAWGPLPASARQVLPTTSASGSDLNKGTVRDGPFMGRLRNLGPVETHRVSVVLSGDANANAAFIGSVYVYGISDEAM